MNILTITICILAVILLIFAFKTYKMQKYLAKILIDMDNRCYGMKLDLEQLKNRQESNSKMLQEQLFISHKEREAWRATNRKLADKENELGRVKHNGKSIQALKNRKRCEKVKYEVRSSNPKPTEIPLTLLAIEMLKYCFGNVKSKNSKND